MDGRKTQTLQVQSDRVSPPPHIYVLVLSSSAFCACVRQGVIHSVSVTLRQHKILGAGQEAEADFGASRRFWRQVQLIAHAGLRVMGDFERML